MKFPSLIVFNDGSMKAVHSVDEINRDIEWSGVNYDENDFIIDSALSVSRFSGNSKEDKLTTILLNYGNIICRGDSEYDIFSIVKTLEVNIKKCNVDDEEIILANNIIQIINEKIMLNGAGHIHEDTT